MDRDDPFIGRANGFDRTSGPRVDPDMSAAHGAISRGATTGSAASDRLLFAGALLDRLNRGVVVLEVNSVPVFMNRVAAAIVQRRDAFAVSAGRLVLLDRRARQAWGAFLNRLARAAEHATGSVVLRVERGNHAPPYRIRAERLDGPAASSAGSSALVVLFIYEPRCDCSISLPVLVNLYGLTTAEARLTANLYKGRSLTGAAAHLGISVNTARCQLKHVFAKCEVQSQAELLQLLALGPRTC